MAKKSKSAGADTAGGARAVAVNRRAKFDYAIEETFEAGLVLMGTEVKSLRAGKCSLREGFIRIIDREAWIVGVQISEYTHGNRANHDPLRSRKLLLHRREIDRLRVRLDERGYTGIPMEIRFINGRAKLTFGIGKGKKHFDKRADAREKTDKREMARALRDG